MNKILILFSFLFSFIAVAEPIEMHECGMGTNCSSITKHKEIINYWAEYNGYNLNVAVTLELESLTSKEPDSKSYKTILNFDVSKTDVSITLSQCNELGSCGRQEFARTLEYQGQFSNVFLQQLLNSHLEKSIENTVKKFESVATLTKINALQTIVTTSIQNLTSPVYIKFYDSNGLDIGMFRVLFNANGSLDVLYDVIYEAPEGGEGLVHMPEAALHNDLNIARYIFMLRVTACESKAFGYTDFDGTWKSNTRWVCKYTHVEKETP